jgi:REP element-mobilizing transposase RayT
MSNKLYIKDTYHHIYNRGTLRSNIYFEDEDFRYFLNRLRKYKDKYDIRIAAFCLLSNHYHILAKQASNEFTIGKFIGDLQNGYTKFINKKYKRTGVLFEGPAKTIFVKEKIYLNWIAEYILLNPVEAKLVDSAKEWEYSSAYELIKEPKNMITSIVEQIEIYGSLTKANEEIKELTSKKYPKELGYDLRDVMNLEG